MNPNVATLLYLASGVLFILALRGLSSPVTSRRGNTMGMVGMALAVGILAYAGSAMFRRLLLAADLRWLIGVQLWRVVGAELLLGYAFHELPPSFAIPAGVGDILIGLAAPFVAVVAASGAPGARRVVIGWCVAGIADLVVAVTMGVLNAPGTFGLLAGEITTAPMLELPRSLIPTFLVPLSVLLHLIVLRRSGEIGRVRGDADRQLVGRSDS